MSHPFPIISSLEIHPIKQYFPDFSKKSAFFEIKIENFYVFLLNSEESLFELGENQIETAMGITIEAASVCSEGTNEVLEKESENMSNTFGVKLRKKSRFGQDLERSGSKRRSGIQNDTGKIQFHFIKKFFQKHEMTLNWPKKTLLPFSSFFDKKWPRFDLEWPQNEPKKVIFQSWENNYDLLLFVDLTFR